MNQQTEAIHYTMGASGARFALIVHHTDAEREWAYDRKSPFGRLDKARRSPDEGLDRRRHEERLEDNLPVRE